MPASAPCKSPLHQSLPTRYACKERLEANHATRRHLKHKTLPVYTANTATAFAAAAAARLRLCRTAAAAAVCSCCSEAMCHWCDFQQLALSAGECFNDGANLQRKSSIQATLFTQATLHCI
jgi:hypothetical protein